ncbi:MAG: thiamine pyrophosphate-dependent enzyme [Thermodesulfobacteriota bacterium]
MSDAERFQTDAEIQWCPGCPNFSLLKAFRSALARLDLAPHRLCLVSGIGQAAKLPHYVRCNFFNGLHGRALPVATAVAAANPELTTVVVTGEGDCYGEGGNHFLHALRRNPNLTVVVHDNRIYALTKGQGSPTTPLGERRSIQFPGVEVEPLNPLGIAVVQGCTFVARGFAPEVEHLADLLAQAMEHPGLSVVDVIQPCITWDPHPVSWYKERVYRLEDDYDPTDPQAALAKTREWGEGRLPIGVLFRADPKPVFGRRFREEIAGGPLAALPPVAVEAIEEVLERMRP